MKEEYFAKVSIPSEGCTERKLKGLERLLEGKLMESGVARAVDAGVVSGVLDLSPSCFFYEGRHLSEYVFHFSGMTGGVDKLGTMLKRRLAPLLKAGDITGYGGFRVTATDVPSSYKIISDF